MNRTTTSAFRLVLSVYVFFAVAHTALTGQRGATVTNILNSRKTNNLRGQEVDRAGLRAKWQARWKGALQQKH